MRFLIISAFFFFVFLLSAKAIERLSKPGGPDSNDSKKEGDK